MSNVSVTLDTNAIKTEILQADWMLTFIESEADKRAGSGEHVKPFIGFDRAKAIIYPDTKEHPG